MVHGRPTLEPRLAPAPVRIPLPKAVYQGSLYENQRTLGHRYFATADEPARGPGPETESVPERESGRGRAAAAAAD